MKGMSRILCCMTLCSLLPLVADAAGTYYNGNLYQNPQSKYNANASTNNNAGGFYNNYGAGRGYGQNMQGVGVTKTASTTKKSTSTRSSGAKKGFHVGANITHEFSNWDLKMRDAGSELRYDNLRWNVLSGEAAYYFGNSTPMQIKIGGSYGVQFGDSPMIDDDVTSGNMWEVQNIIVGGVTEEALFGTPALSIGTSKSGKQYGFNAAFGFTDLFNTGRVKMTPSIGYRYFKYQLETKSNYGLMVDVVNSNSFVNCVEVQAGEIQCGPYIGFADGNGNVFGYAGFEIDANGNLVQNPDGSYIILNNTSAAQLDAGETYYYEQSGTSHKYQTEWAGPYLALDMEYMINNDNIVNAGVEFGLPMYKSRGDQPYRFDWAHPTSVEDKGDFGDAYHLGFNAMWSTSVSESVMLSLGMTYDYYRVKDATATTYLNPTYYQAILTDYETAYAGGDFDDNSSNYDYMVYLQDMKSKGWALESKNEIESIYKSMGIRLGLTAKF